MRVLQVHTRYREAGGEDAVVAAEAELLRSAGHDVVQWIGHNPAGAMQALVALARAPSNRSAAAAVRRAAAEAAPEVVHVHNTWYATSPRALEGLRATVPGPIVMTLHNYRLVCANALLLRSGSPCEICIGRGPWTAVRYGCYRGSRLQSAAAAATISLGRRKGMWVDNVDRFLTLTEFAREKMIAGGLPEDRVVVKPNFVSDPGPRPATAESSDRLLFVGRITAEKGIGTILDAWEMSPPPGLRLTVAGDGPLYEELRSRRVPGVELVGRVDGAGVQRLMFDSRALLFPSVWYEGMPVTLLESFASGLPVMGSRIGSVEEMVAPFGDEWLAPPGRAAAWAEQIALLADDGRVRAASAIARKLWRDRYGPERALRNLEAAYRA